MNKIKFTPAVCALAVFPVVIIGAGLIWAIPPARAQTSPPDSARVPAAAAKVTREDLFKEVTVSAEFRPYQEVELHAKVSGYLQKITVDFGDQVTNGQLLAMLEVPELQDELVNAQAIEQKAESDYTNAHLIYSRLMSVNKDHPNLVAQQDLDTASANDQTTAAAIAAAGASVGKFKTMISYTRITAPFDGVVTRRYADPGALIQAGTASDTQARPLVRVSDNYRLRLDFPVTVDFVKDIKVGAEVEGRVGSLGGKTFSGKISRFTHDVDDNTRTMMTEIEVPNPGLELMPGMYASVILKVEEHPGALAIPIEAVSSLKNPTVLVINQDQQIEERVVKLGLETPEKFEVLSGLQAGNWWSSATGRNSMPVKKVAPKLLPLSVSVAN